MGKRGKENAQKTRQLRLLQISQLRTIPYSDEQRWWSSETVAVVTGANRGIGFEIAKQLAVHGLTVVITSREDIAGLEAYHVLCELGLSVAFHRLNVVDPQSIAQFATWVEDTYGGLDILINNAGVNYNVGSDNSVEFARQVIETNYYGTKNVTNALMPLMRPSNAGARVVNVSSRLGRLHGRRNRIGDPELRKKLGDIGVLTEDLIDEVVASFLKQVEDGTWQHGGWPQNFTDYSMSKLAVNAHTRVFAKKLGDRSEGHKIYANCFYPGWVKTAMTGWAGNVAIEDAADTAVWLALLPDLAVTGKFFAERREINF